MAHQRTTHSLLAQASLLFTPHRHHHHHQEADASMSATEDSNSAAAGPSASEQASGIAQEKGQESATQAAGATTLATAGPSADGASQRQSGGPYPLQPSIEDEVKQLVGSVSSWWSGFSKRSQEQLEQARAQIDAQGGIVSMARREAQRFEAQLTEAQKQARAQVVKGEDDRERSTIDIDGLTATGSYTPPVIQGKGKGKVTDGDDGVAVDRLEERAQEQRRARKTSEDDEALKEGTGESIFDAESLGGLIDHKAVDEAVHAARQNAQSAIESVQTFWGKLQADPRVNSVQASVAQTLQNIKVPKAGTHAADEDTFKEKDAQSSALPDLTKQFQGAFPHLNWKESQTMAKRYFEASQSAAQEWGKEMSHLVGDLVKIVPPEEVSAAQPSASQGAKKASVAAATSTKSPRTNFEPLSTADADDDDFFDWDKEVEPRSTASEGAQSVAGPGSTTDSSLVDVGATTGAEMPGPAPAISDGAGAATNATSSSKPGPAPALDSGKIDHEDDDESDWE